MMKPIDFVVYEGDSEPNTPVYEIAEAMMQDIIVHGPTGEFVVYGYYYDAQEKRMVLEIKKKVK
jgi:RPA family protein